MSTFIGIVDYRHPEKDGKKGWCKLKPLHRSVDQDWVSLTDRERTFPPDGTVYWRDCPPTALKGTGWVFEVEEQGNELNPKHNKFKVGPVQPSRLTCFITLGDRDTRTELRRFLAGDPMSVTHSPPGEVAVRIPGDHDRWVGPLDLDFEENAAGRFLATNRVASGFIDVREVPATALQLVELYGASWRVIRPNESLLVSTDQFCCQSDDELIESFLKRLRKFDRKACDALEVTSAVYEDYVAALAHVGLLGPDRLKENDRKEAGKLLLERIAQANTSLHEIVDALLDTSRMQDSLEDATERRIEEAVEERRGEIEAKCAAENERLAEARSKESSVRSRITKLEDRVRQLASEAEASEQWVTDRAEELRGRLRVIIQDAVEEPARLLVEDSLVAALRDHRRVGPSAAPSLTRNGGEPLEDLAELRKALRKAAVHWSADPLVACWALGWILAGRVPALVGPIAPSLAASLALSISGERAYGVPVPASVFGIQDLLDLPSVCLGAGNDSGALLGELLEANQREDASSAPLALVLTGVNNAPLEVAATALVRGGLGRSAGPATLPWRNNGRITALDVGRNLVVIATMSEGRATFQLPADCRELFGLVDTRVRSFDPDILAQAKSADETSSWLSAQSLLRWQEDLSRAPESQLPMEYGLPASLSPNDAYRELRAIEKAIGDAGNAEIAWCLGAGVPHIRPPRTGDESKTPFHESVEQRSSESYLKQFVEELQQ